ncbi:hypothetical protein MTO96_001404 [Rhipicephalus appendiculatus]
MRERQLQLTAPMTLAGETTKWRCCSTSAPRGYTSFPRCLLCHRRCSGTCLRETARECGLSEQPNAGEREGTNAADFRGDTFRKSPTSRAIRLAASAVRPPPLLDETAPRRWCTLPASCTEDGGPSRAPLTRSERRVDSEHRM